MRLLLVLCGQLWALPTTLLGLLIIAPSGARPYALRPAGAWWWVAEKGFWAWWFRNNGMAALTCGAVTVCLPEYADNAVTIRHERVHLRQCFWMGATFVPVYYLLCALLWLARKDPYRENPLEEEAYRLQDRMDSWG